MNKNEKPLIKFDEACEHPLIEIFDIVDTSTGYHIQPESPEHFQEVVNMALETPGDPLKNVKHGYVAHCENGLDIYYVIYIVTK